VGRQQDAAATRRSAEALLAEYGEHAAEMADRRMQEEMHKGDVQAAGFWLGVLYELTRVSSAPHTT
jgi:hypothetical protein